MFLRVCIGFAHHFNVITDVYVLACLYRLRSSFQRYHRCLCSCVSVSASLIISTLSQMSMFLRVCICFAHHFNVFTDVYVLACLYRLRSSVDPYDRSLFHRVPVCFAHHFAVIIGVYVPRILCVLPSSVDPYDRYLFHQVLICFAHHFAATIDVYDQSCLRVLR